MDRTLHVLAGSFAVLSLAVTAVAQQQLDDVEFESVGILYDGTLQSDAADSDPLP